VRSNLALVDYQISLHRHWIIFMMGTPSIVVGAGLFSWTLIRSQNIPHSSFGGWNLFMVLVVVLALRATYKGRDEMRKAKPKLELRQRRLRELLAALEARE
jgi:hypothetical protein